MTDQETRILKNLCKHLDAGDLAHWDMIFVRNVRDQGFNPTRKQMKILFNIINNVNTPMYGKRYMQGCGEWDDGDFDWSGKHGHIF